MDLNTAILFNYRELLQALMTPIPEIQAIFLHNLLSSKVGDAAQTETVSSIMCTATNQEMEEIKDTYKSSKILMSFFKFLFSWHRLICGFPHKS